MRRVANVLLTLAFAAPAAAQQATATLNANLPPVARLSLSTNSITFVDADPDMLPAVPASPPSVSVVAKMRATQGATATLTVEATDDLRSGLDIIPVSNITWTGTGPGFVGGTLSRMSPQLLGSWSSSGVRAGEQRFVFANRWTYAPGTYTVTLVYTLSSP